MYPIFVFSVLSGCGNTQEPSKYPNGQTYTEFKVSLNEYFRLYTGGYELKFLKSDFDAALISVGKSGRENLNTAFIQAIGTLDLELGPKIDYMRSPRRDDNPAYLYSGDAIRFAAACRILANPWISTTPREALVLLQKFQPDRLDPGQRRWWINMMAACAATPSVLLVDYPTCEFQVALAAIADAVIYQRLVTGSHYDSQHVRFATTKGMIPQVVRGQVARISDAIKPMYVRLMDLYLKVLDNPNKPALELINGDIEVIDHGATRAQFHNHL